MMTAILANGIKVAFARTPQASNDQYASSEDARCVWTPKVSSNGLGGAARALAWGSRHWATG
jgi:hypothetical protein